MHYVKKPKLMLKELRNLGPTKDAFFQNMSHELRTPLTLILNPLENQSREQPENTELNVATKNSRRLLRLVNQLLDFQKLEAGKKELELAPLDIHRFTHVCGDYFHSACSTKGVAFKVERDGAPFSRRRLAHACDGGGRRAREGRLQLPVECAQIYAQRGLDCAGSGGA